MGGKGQSMADPLLFFTWPGSNRSNLNQAAILLKGLRKELSAKTEDKEDASAVTF